MGLLSFGFLVFGACAIVLLTLALPHGGPKKGDLNRLRKRVEALSRETEGRVSVDLLREQYRSKLSMIDRWVIRVPGVENHIDYSDYVKSIARIRNMLLVAAILSLLLSRTVWSMTHSLPGTLVTFALILFGPMVWMRHAVTRRIAAFEVQLPEALDTMTRGLKAGYPLTDTLHLVAVQMEAPLATEFKIMLNEINVGIDMRSAFMNLLARVPSISLMAFTTAVLLQRETGGNLTETLVKISNIIRDRFAFQRNIKTLTAEARLSGWVLALLPFGLFIVVYIVNPEYAMVLIRDPEGQRLTLIGLGLMVAGSLWMRHMIQLDV